MLPPDDPTDESASRPEPDDQPRHPFTYRAPAETEPEPPLAADDVAEEVRRNDAVLLWAAGLMAAVFACTTIADTRVLVHVKTGLSQAANGFLPPGKDVFSATAFDRPWVNLNWLFDLLVAGLHAVGGFTALTIFQAVAAVGVVLLILACRRSEVPSWWAASIAVLAGVAMTPHFESRPVLVTLLGLGVTLWLLTRYRHELHDYAVWWLVPLFALWSNLDPRMFLGLAVLLLYGLGELLGTALSRPGFEDGSRRGRYWLAVAASFVASMANPFLWKAPLGAIGLYGQVDPAYRQYFGGDDNWSALPHLPLFSHPPNELLDHVDLLAALLLAAVAGVTLILNRRRLDVGQATLWAGFLGLGLLAGRELTTAAVVFAVLAIQNAEDWYRKTFRQSYGTERSELIFSRGGRALTVIAMAALAGLWLMGKVLLADDGRRPGFGLDARLGDQLASLDELLNPPFDDRVFNFHAVQGDQLIWLGFRPFIDHRLELYRGRSGDSTGDDLIALHDKVRHAMLPAISSDPASGRPDEWKLALERFGIIQALPRLTLPNPAYGLYFALIQSPDWRLGGLDAAGALFYRRDAVDEALQEHLTAHGLNLTRDAFREPTSLPERQAAWPRERSWTDSLRQSNRMSNEIARALHFLQHLERTQSQGLQLPPEAAFAFAYLAIRDCYAALAEDPQNLVAYQCLGRIYEMLFVLESNGSGIEMRRRLYQSLDAYGQALAVAPDEPTTHERLIALYLAFNKMDLAQQARDRYITVTGNEPAGPAGEQAKEQWKAMWDQIADQVEQVTARATDAIAAEQPRLDTALFAWQNGCTRLALELIDGDPALAQQNPDVQRLRALLLLESARPEEAFEQLSALEPMAIQMGLSGWREALALASLALPDYVRAAELWRDDAAEASEKQLMTAMQTIPVAGPLHGGAVFPIWQTNQAVQAMLAVPQEVAQGEFNAALCELEAGQIDAAEKTLTSLLERHPQTPFTVLAAFYLEQIRGKPFELKIGSDSPEDRFAEVESRLSAKIVADQLKAAGPVTAVKPTPPPAKPAD